MTHEELCRHIVDSTPDAITHADRHGIIQLWNTGAETLFGYSECEALGRSLNLIIPDRLRQRHRDGYHRVMTTGQTHHGHELLAVPGLHNDGTRISLEFSIIMLRDAAGEPNGISAIPRDVTQHREHDRALQQRLAAAEAQSSMLPSSARPSVK